MKECKEYLNLMGLRNQITLIWVPGRSGVECNEEPDELAKVGSATSTDGVEPYLPIQQSVSDEALTNWRRKRHKERWEAYEGGVHTKHFFPRPNSK